MSKIARESELQKSSKPTKEQIASDRISQMMNCVTLGAYQVYMHVCIHVCVYAFVCEPLGIRYVCMHVFMYVLVLGAYQVWCTSEHVPSPDT